MSRRLYYDEEAKQFFPEADVPEKPILQTYKVAFDAIIEIGGLWIVGQDKNLYYVEMTDKVKECMWKNAKRYDIQTGKVIGYTNGDKIRHSTDEEIAEMVAKEIAYLQGTILRWLKQEVSDEL